MPVITYLRRRLRFLFFLDELPAERVYSKITAYYHLDGTLRLAQGTQVVFEEVGVPLVEFAVWLSGWWTSHQPARSYEPDGSDPDHGPMLVLVPAGGNRHRLTYTWGDAVVHWTAEQDEWKKAVTQFRQALCQVVLERYQLRLDGLLPPFRSSL